MRIALVFLALACMVTPAVAQGSSRASVIIDALDVDQQTASKLHEVLVHHDAELEQLSRTRAELKRRLVGAQRDPNGADRLLADWSANQRALSQLEDHLLVRVRQLLPGPKAVHLLMLISLTESMPLGEPVWQYTNQPRPRSHDPNALFPPGSAQRLACDPFASMHGCRYSR